MDVGHASVDSHVERLNDLDLDDLRAIFRYFDTDHDGAVSANQACRMFTLLGLEVNVTQVRELEEVYLHEFIKIVDSHVPVSPPDASQGPAVEKEKKLRAQDAPGARDEDQEKKLRMEKALDDEWKLLDTYCQGRVSMQELRRFLGSCQSRLSQDGTERLLEIYGTITENDELELTKEGFIRFCREYTLKK